MRKKWIIPATVAGALVLGMSGEELRSALAADGATLAQVAEDQGVEVDTLVDALAAAEEERIAAAVADGRLSQEEADERLADLQARITERVRETRPDRPEGRGRTAPGGTD